MNSIGILTLQYEEGIGTRTVIDGIRQAHLAQGDAVHCLAVVPPRRSSPVLGKDAYLDLDCTLEMGSILRVLADRLAAMMPTHLYVILGHPLMLALLARLDMQSRTCAILYFLDPWFTFPELREAIHARAREFLAFRTTWVSRNAELNLFRKLREIEEAVGREAYDHSIYEGIKGLIVCSTDMRDFFIDKVGLDENLVRCFPLYVPPVAPSPTTPLLAPFRPRSDPRERPVILYVGGTSGSWKGFWLIPAALRALPHVDLEVFTWSEDEGELARMLWNHYQLDPARLAIRVGYSADVVRDAMSRVDATVISSLAEGFSFVMAESMESGCLTVAGPLFGGPRDVIQDNLNGFLFEPGDSTSLTQVLIRCLEGKDTATIRQHAIATAQGLSYRRYCQTLIAASSRRAL